MPTTAIPTTIPTWGRDRDRYRDRRHRRGRHRRLHATADARRHDRRLHATADARYRRRHRHHCRRQLGRRARAGGSRQVLVYCAGGGLEGLTARQHCVGRYALSSSASLPGLGVYRTDSVFGQRLVDAASAPATAEATYWLMLHVHCQYTSNNEELRAYATAVGNMEKAREYGELDREYRKGTFWISWTGALAKIVGKGTIATRRWRERHNRAIEQAAAARQLGPSCLGLPRPSRLGLRGPSCLGLRRPSRLGLATTPPRQGNGALVVGAWAMALEVGTSAMASTPQRLN